MKQLHRFGVTYQITAEQLGLPEGSIVTAHWNRHANRLEVDVSLYRLTDNHIDDDAAKAGMLNTQFGDVDLVHRQTTGTIKPIL